MGHKFPKEYHEHTCEKDGDMPVLYHLACQNGRLEFYVGINMGWLPVPYYHWTGGHEGVPYRVEI